ncbi:MAG TPA: hypothetical protein VHR45_06940 [Thermoanaerobaculia bacterium]|nr:hypothetical protein [Thermoanaerobaculia bacterium]
MLTLLLACTALAVTAAPGLAAAPPSRLRLRVPRDPLLPGQQASLTIEAVGDPPLEISGQRAEPLPATRPIEIALAGATALTVQARVVLRPGQPAIEVPIRAARPGVWVIEASSPGLYSAIAHVVCIDQKTLDSHRLAAGRLAPAPTAVRKALQAEKALAMAPLRPAPPRPATPGSGEKASAAEPGRPAARSLGSARPAAAPPTAEPVAPTSVPVTIAVPVPGAAAPPPSGAATGEGAARAGGPATAAGGTSGEVRLVPDHLKQRRGTGGWDSVALYAYWYEGGNPSPASRNIDVALFAQQGELQIEPQRLSIASGDFVSQRPVTVSAGVPETAVLQALYPGGQSNPVELEFLAPAPVRLAFDGAPELIRGFGTVRSGIYVRLLDASGQPVAADQPVPITVELIDPTGARTQPAVPASTSINAAVALDLSRWGKYTVRAFAPSLAEAAPLAIQFAIDWLLLVVALVGGIAGSLIRVLYLSERSWRSGLVRVVALGSAAALLVVLLWSFGLLSLLSGSMPEGFATGLQRIPVGSLAGVFLLGLLGGLLFDTIFGRLLHRAVGGSSGGGPPAGGGAPRPIASP